MKDYPLNIELYAQIRELFPLEIGSTTIVEILSIEPLKYQVFKYDRVDEASEQAVTLADEEKTYFVIDGLIHNVPIFLYKDRYLTFRREYNSHNTLRYSLRDPNKVVTHQNLLTELEMLESNLKAKAS